jgi:hypothetical protein
MRIARLTGLALASAAAMSGCVFPGQHISAYGKTATLYLRDGHEVVGELIATSGDTIWVRERDVVTGFAHTSIRKVNVERHPFDGYRSIAVSAISGLVTGAALGAACGSYNRQSGSSSGCSGVLPGTLLFFVGVGSVFALSNDYSSQFHLVPADTGRIRSYSRFPQGIPDSLRWRRIYGLPASP